MKIVHILVGEEQAKSFSSKINKNDPEKEEVFALHDFLNIGPLRVEGQTFSEGRNELWKRLMPSGRNFQIDDLERLMALSTRLSNGEDLQIWFWSCSNSEEVCAYFWLLHYLKKHSGNIFLVNIAGLPFLDEDGKLFYPHSIGQLSERELQKARKLRRALSGFEMETDVDEWRNLREANAEIRILEGSKTILGSGYDYFDQDLKELQNRKSQKALLHLKHKHKIQISGNVLFEWRFQSIMASEESA